MKSPKRGADTISNPSYQPNDQANDQNRTGYSVAKHPYTSCGRVEAVIYQGTFIPEPALSSFGATDGALTIHKLRVRTIGRRVAERNAAGTVYGGKTRRTKSRMWTVRALHDSSSRTTPLVR